MATLPGINWRNANELEPGAFETFAAGRFGSAVVMSTSPPGLPNELASRYPAARGIARLFLPHDRLPAPAEAVAIWRPYIRLTAHLAIAGWLLYQVENEPDHKYADTTPEVFSYWYMAVLMVLAAEFPEIRPEAWGFPMPSVRGQESMDYIARCKAAVLMAGWLAERGYWQEAWQRDDTYWGRRYIRTRLMFPNKVIHLAEYGCSDPDLAPWIRAAQYREYVASLPDDIASANAFIMAGGTEDWRLFWIDRAMAEAMRPQEEGPVDLSEQFPQEYQQWVDAGGPANNFRKHALGIGLVTPTADDLKFLAEETAASLGQLRGALERYPFP